MNKISATAITVLGAAVLVLSAAACNGNSSNAGQQQENRQQGQDTTTYEQDQPIPHFPYSEYRQTAISVEAIQALGEQTTSFFFNLGVKNPIFTCPSLGSPFPNTAELSNPDQVVTPTGGSNSWAVEFWAEHVDLPGSVRAFRVFGTGHPLPPDARWIGTCPRTSGLVFHLFEVTP